MAANREQFYVETFSANIMPLAQQMESGIRNAVQLEAAQGIGNQRFIRQYGASEFELLENRLETPEDTETPRRNTILSWAKYARVEHFDEQDEISSQVVEPNSQLQRLIAAGSERLFDNTFFDNVLGNATRGSTVDSSFTTTAFPASQQVAATYHEDGTGDNADISLGKIRRAEAILNANEVEEMDRYIAWASRQSHILKADTTVLSSEFNNQKPLTDGRMMPKIFSFNIIQSERVNKTGNNRSVIAWQKNGVIMADSGLEIHADIDIKQGHSLQLAAYRKVGMARLEEERVVEIVCDESAEFGA